MPNTKTLLRASPKIILGVGDTYEARLKDAGIKTIADLLTRRIKAIQSITKHASLREIQEWLSVGYFLQLPGVTPHIAEALFEGGIDTLEELSDTDLAALEKILTTAHNTERLSELPSIYQIAGFQQAAWRTLDTGAVYGWLEDEEGSPLSGKTVAHGRVKMTTDETGYYELVGLPEGDRPLIIDAGNHPFTIPVQIKAGRVSGPMTIRFSSPPPDAVEPEAFHEHDDGLLVLGKGSTLQTITRELSDIPDDTYIQVRYFRKDGQVRLLHLYRVQVGNKMLAERVYLHEDDLPEDIDVGNILHYVEGGFKKTELTPRDVARMKLERLIGKRRLILKKRLIPVLPGR